VVSSCTGISIGGNVGKEVVVVVCGVSVVVSSCTGISIGDEVGCCVVVVVSSCTGISIGDDVGCNDGCIHMVG